MIIMEFECDQCKEEIKGQGLALEVIKPPEEPKSVMTLVYIPPILDREHHFCCFTCLGAFVDGRRL